jgi:drug/metabolite transporter (DMT)-like permease
MSSTTVFTALAMIAFAANSLFARLALAGGAIDAAGYTGVRMASGAAFLALILWRRPGRAGGLPGSWRAAAALGVYAIGFSLAYLRLGVSLGALVLFTAVQVTMIAWSVIRGEHPGRVEIAGIVLALAGFVYLVSPGLVAPDPLGCALMVIAGVAWGVYSILGRGGADPVGQTAGNFIRIVPMALPLIVVSLIAGGMTAYGVVLALAAGVFASALGYILWYRALPGLAMTQAAIVQLSVPVIAALGAVIFLSETLTARLLIAGAVMLGGIALAILSRRRA